ncbi:magnesium transporter [Acuticoccus sp. I52.16.1]|uniref:magnesium transporter n=1 Tax=Acuticoccus sp. I52.16.1 TaxID=2928472 RepID=UPI001FD60F5F|nr:magnesium transporter [Acuticoccus sp. I52.16.1]UOM34187.1 magnesium transporter [Acuticoccus sp. I52.16.1]
MADQLTDDEVTVSDGLLDEVRALIGADDKEGLTALVEDLHESDVAELISRLEPDERVEFVRLLGRDFDFTALTEVDENVRLHILSELAPTDVADGLADLDSDDAVYILEDLPDEQSEAILAQLPFAMRHRLKRSLDFPEESAGRRMQTDFVAMPPFWTVGQVIDTLREEVDLPDHFTEIFVVDAAFRLMGTVKLDRLLRTQRPVKITEIMDEDPRTIQAEEDQEEAARIFQRYDLLSAAVVDDSSRLVGILTIDDIVDIIEAEAEEDIRALAGAGDAELSDTPLYVARTRIPWLMINMMTAFLASGVIALFDGTIEAMVALAVLMPVVTALGGNAGIQAMTVTVRAISQREITKRNVIRVTLREVLVALMNGTCVAVSVGIVAAVWFANIELGGVIAAAIVFNIICAGFFGATLPMLLDRIGVDPAVASSVFLTTLTDVIGFFAFLGIGSWWFGIG